MKSNAASAILLCTAWGVAGWTPGAVGQTVVVATDEQARIDQPVSVALSARSERLPSLRLVEITAGRETPVPAQVEPGNPPRIWWIVRGETPARCKRLYRITPGDPVPGPEVTVEHDRGLLEVRLGQRSVLRYNSAHVEPPGGTDEKYGRSAFIHPIWTPNGVIVSDQFPPDHLHQSGVFLAHTKTEFEGRTPNFWDLLGGGGRVRFKDVQAMTDGPVFGEFCVEHEHVDLTAPEEKVALLEMWTVRVWNIGGIEAGFWVWDVVSELTCATPSSVRLKQDHYGGMALRGARSWDANHGRFVTSDGKDRVAGNHTRPRWCDLSGPVGDRIAGITFLTHSSNFRFPEPLRIHPTMPYMVYTPSHLGDWDIMPGKAHRSHYRFVAHDGDIPTTTAERLWRDFSEPMAVSFLDEPDKGTK